MVPIRNSVHLSEWGTEASVSHGVWNISQLADFFTSCRVWRSLDATLWNHRRCVLSFKRNFCKTCPILNPAFSWSGTICHHCITSLSHHAGLPLCTGHLSSAITSLRCLEAYQWWVDFKLPHHLRPKMARDFFHFPSRAYNKWVFYNTVQLRKTLLNHFLNDFLEESQ